MSDRIKTFCALCVSRCGALATVHDGHLVALDPDPTHPTGHALCIKGKVAPELVDSAHRLLHPLKRTRPKSDPDPGWIRISWDEALDTTARKLRAIAEQYGPESTVFASASPSTSAMADAVPWVQRLRRAYGSPNLLASVELCAWGRYFANTFAYGASLPAAYMPELERTGCILFWGYNPSVSRIAHATAAVKAINRGAKLIVVDPRKAGLAGRADVWIRPRPGTDGAVALAIAHVMIERGWYDEPFVRQWTNAPLLVREDTGAFLSARDLSDDTGPERLVAWNEPAGRPELYDPNTGTYTAPEAELALFGRHEIATLRGTVVCRPAFDHVSEVCRRNAPGPVADLTGVPDDVIESAARTLWESRPVAYYTWSGIEQQTNATQIARAIGLLYALTGSFDAPGGNVLFASVPSNDVEGAELLSAEQRRKALGLGERPLGAARWEFVTTRDAYKAMLEHEPYRVRGLVSFGANLLLSQADSERGRKALETLEFHVHADLFMNPTAEMADIVLPVASPFESRALKIGFEVSAEAQTLVQLRHALVAPRGESRSDTDIIFDLACRLGLAEQFWDGDVDAAYRYQLAPSGVSLEALEAEPAGVRVRVETRYRKFAETKGDGPVGFATPTHKIELFSARLRDHGIPPVPEYEEPMMSPRSRADLEASFPLILTSTKSTYFCESQHRGLPSLRKKAPDPEVEIHPLAARARGIAAGTWVRIVTPEGAVRARARFNETLDPGVVCGQHGWWQACPELGLPSFDPFSDDGANLNRVIGFGAIDPVSGSVPLRAYMCQVERAL
jgi:anaerobic selenocysteine-containing dehydrogenase